MDKNLAIEIGYFDIIYLENVLQNKNNCVNVLFAVFFVSSKCFPCELFLTVNVDYIGLSNKLQTSKLIYLERYLLIFPNPFLKPNLTSMQTRET